MTPPIVSLTLNYRDAARTHRCVQSLLADGAIHVLVWDNSADHGKSASELSITFADERRVSIIESPGNLGFAAGVNRGIDWLHTHYSDAWIFLINNDAILLPNGLRTLHTALSTNSKAILAYPDIDHGGQVLGTIWYHRFFALITYYPLLGSFPYPSGCAMLFAPERCHEKLFNEEFFMYGEDIFLGWTCRDNDHLLYIPRILVWHEGSVSSGMASSFYEARLVACHLQLARKMASNNWDYVKLLLGRFISLPMRAMLRTVRYRSTAPLKALITGWQLSQRDQAPHTTG